MTPLDLEQQLQQHGNALRGLARDLVRDRDVADDLVQDTLQCALGKPPAQPGPIGGWLATVLRRLHLQRRRRELHRAGRERVVARPELLPSTIDQVERRETLRAVTTAVFALAEPYQTTLLLRYFEDLTPTEIAARTATSVATVKSRLQRALLLLRGRLDATLGDRHRWTRALCVGTGLQWVSTTTILGTGVLLMGTTTKLALGGAAAMLLGALAWTLFDQEPAPAQPTVTAAENAPATATAATSIIDAAASTDPDRVALPAATPDNAALLHPFTYQLEVQVQDRLGLPVEGVRVLLAPPGCRLDEVPEHTDSSGTVLIEWRGRSASMPVMVATRSDEISDSMRLLTIASGNRARVVIGGSSGQHAGLRLVSKLLQPEGTNGFFLALEGIVLQQGIFADNPRMREGLHPFASFGDVQWRQHDGSEPQGVEFSGHEIGFSVNGSAIQFFAKAVGEQNEVEPRNARIAGFVYDEDGKPCAKCPVAWGLQVDRPSQRTETDERGGFHFDDVPEGGLELRAGGSDAGLQHQTISTLRGQTTTTDVHLRRQASVRGRAVGADGKPLAGWRVEWLGTQMPWFDACTVAGDGDFVLTNLPGGPGQLLLWRSDGQSRLPVLQTDDVLFDNGQVELRFDPASGDGRLQLEPALPDGIDRAAVEVRVFQEDTGRGTTLQKEKDSNQFALAGLAAGWYRLELGGPGLGWLDAGRHYVDGKSLVDLGRVNLPRSGSLRLLLPPNTELQPVAADSGFVLEIYHRRADCDVRLEDPATASGAALPLAPGDYFALWRSAAGAPGFKPFTVKADREVEVDCSGGGVR